MNLEEARATYYEFSGKTSDVARQLAFAGIAVIWVFSGASLVKGRLQVPSDLIWPGIVLVGTLAADFLQYVTTTVTWGIFARVKETSGTSEDADFTVSPWLNVPALFFFWLKVPGIVAAYVLLLIALADRLH